MKCLVEKAEEKCKCKNCIERRERIKQIAAFQVQTNMMCAFLRALDNKNEKND